MSIALTICLIIWLHDNLYMIGLEARQKVKCVINNRLKAIEVMSAILTQKGRQIAVLLVPVLFVVISNAADGTTWCDWLLWIKVSVGKIVAEMISFQNLLDEICMQGC